jgi:PhnB protein
MASTSTYLNFTNQTEEAFNFYRSIFGGEFVWPIARFGDIPPMEWMPPLAPDDAHGVMHICLPILGGHKLMGTDAPESMGFTLNQGNNVYISLHPDSREEADRIFSALMEGGQIELPLQDMFWGAYYGSGKDQFGIQWMVHFEAQK